MKLALFLSIILFASINTQKVNTDDKYSKYRSQMKHYEDGEVEIGSVIKENKRISDSLNEHIATKVKLIKQGDAYNVQMKKVNSNIGKWGEDIKKTVNDTQKVKTHAKVTRKQWTEVKKTQEVPSVKKPSSKLRSKKILRRLQVKTEQRKKNEKTLEKVNAQYNKQVIEIEKNVNEVIKKIQTVYKQAAKDDSDAKVLQETEVKKLNELKTFLKHLLEYIQWTTKTMKSYSELFHVRPDNVFLKKTEKLEKIIKKVL